MDLNQFADIHCHTVLKTFGHSFDKVKKGRNQKSDVWYYHPPGLLSKFVNLLTGITRFSQADFTTMSKGNVRIAFISLYPPEKGYVINSLGKGYRSATVLDAISCIGYNRIRYVQEHADYFADLTNEYQYLQSCANKATIDSQSRTWSLTKSWHDVEQVLVKENNIAVVLTIEGAHVFNTGLGSFGVALNEEQVLENVYKVKNWMYAPLFITFGHCFDNELCGHARSLEVVDFIVDQEKNIDQGFSTLGLKVLHALLDEKQGRRIYIDIKHMSLKGRREYYECLATVYTGQPIPVIVSHGAVAGISIDGSENIKYAKNYFNQSDINFYDEELVIVAKSGGLFGIQMDKRRIASNEILRKASLNISPRSGLKTAGAIIWKQIQHIAEILDRSGLFSWGTATIGSDFDGTTNPLKGFWTAEYFPKIANELLVCAEEYINNPNGLALSINKQVSAEEIVERFAYSNAARFLKEHY